MANHVRLKTSVPGPLSIELSRRRDQEVPRGIFHSTPVYVASAENAMVTDVDGNVFIDFAGGIGTMNIGHANPFAVNAAVEQAHRFTHTCFSVAGYEAYVQLAEKLNRITPGHFAKKTMLANSGAEAVENAVKIARHSTGRKNVVVFEHAFHGRTLLTMSMTGKVKPYKFGFGPFAPEVYRIPFPYEYRGWSCEASLEALHSFFQSHVAPEEVACVVIELVLGEGGFVVAPLAYINALKSVCKQHGILLIADEIQTGFARTGKMFASEHYELEPDIIILAKSLAGGLPLSAVTGRAEIMDSAQIGGLGGTYGGNPVACAAALAAIGFIEEQRLPERAEKIGQQIRAAFLSMQSEFPFIGDVRGLGAMMALEFVKDRAGKEPDKERTSAFIRKCCEHGLILIAAGTYGNVIRTLMPLVISDSQLQEGLAIMKTVMSSEL